MARHSTYLARIVGGLSIVFSAIGLFPTPGHAADWVPTQNVELIVPSAPGGGNDVTARLIQRIVQDLGIIPTTMTVVNKPGGGGSVSRAYMNQKAGDGHYIAVSPLNLLTNHITGQSKDTYTSVTPIARLFNEYITIAVRADSPIGTGQDLINRLKRDPESLSIGIATARGNQNHLAVALAGRQGGVEIKKLKTVIFQSAGQAFAALLGGHIDVLPSPVVNLAKHLKGGKVKLIAVSSPQRLEGDMSHVPTWGEQGFDAVFVNWRGIIGPTGMSAGQVSYWSNTFDQLNKSEDWKAALKKSYYIEGYMNSQEVKKYMAAQYEELKVLLGELGLARTVNSGVDPKSLMQR